MNSFQRANELYKILEFFFFFFSNYFLIIAEEKIIQNFKRIVSRPFWSEAYNF